MFSKKRSTKYFNIKILIWKNSKCHISNKERMRELGFSHLIVSVFAILGADYIDGVVLVNSRGFVHIDYMVRVGNEKSKNKILISRKNTLYLLTLDWLCSNKGQEG